MDNHGNVDTTDDECVIDDTILSLNQFGVKYLTFDISFLGMQTILRIGMPPNKEPWLKDAITVVRQFPMYILLIVNHNEGQKNAIFYLN